MAVKLTTMQARTFQLYFIQGMRQNEIADLIGISRQAVANRIRRIRDRYDAAGEGLPDVPGRYAVRETLRSTSAWE